MDDTWDVTKEMLRNRETDVTQLCVLYWLLLLTTVKFMVFYLNFIIHD